MVNTTRMETTHVMRHVVYALIPGTAVLIGLFGWGIISNLLLSASFALGFEALLLKLRQRPVGLFLSDFSVIVTAWLLAVAMPAYSPWWLIAIALLFAVVIAKHLYGGLGQNPFNPAMIGYAVVLVSYPLYMTSWADPAHAGFGSIDFATMWQKVMLGETQNWDGFTAATVLDTVKTDLRQHAALTDIMQKPIFGVFGGTSWEWANIAWLLGGAWLLYKRIITWQIPTALIGSLALLAGVFWMWDPTVYTSPVFHILSGATLLGAFFIATDPVTASTTPRGQLIYAAGIGAFIYIIRTWGGYPDAVAFSVIIMNMGVPLIDHYTQPRVYGN